MTLKKTLVACALLAGTAIASQAADAVVFNLIDTGGTAKGTQARAGFDAAAFYWSSVLTDNVTINLNIGFKSLGGNILGQTGSNRAVETVASTYNALNADKTSTLDAAATASLRPLSGAGALTFTANAFSNSATVYSSQATRVDNDGGNNNKYLGVTNANAKALGFTGNYVGTALSATDGSITFSSDYTFDFDPTDGIGANDSDFIGVAIHEIGHALGFVSAADSYDAYTQNVAAGTATTGRLEGSAVGSVLDLYRYSSAGTVDWSANTTDKYFSVDGGVTKFNGNASFDRGVSNGGNQNQASHWLQPADQSTYASACSNFVGIMNPYLCGGYGAIITDDDLAAMDAIGWNLNVDTATNRGYTYTTAQVYNAYQASVAGAVPEPTTWAMLLAGFGLVGGAVRRRSGVLAAA